MIKRFKTLIGNVVGITTTKIECTIDDDLIDCKTFAQPYIGVPAPPILNNDIWFGEPVMSKKQEQFISDNIVVNMDGGVGGSWKVDNEPDNIHEVMYELSTKNDNTLKRGGSELFQENINLG